MFRATVAVIIQNEYDEILLSKRLVDPNIGYWAMPGGKIEFRETILDAACREVLEETGLILNRSLTVLYPYPQQEWLSQQGSHYICFYLFAQVDNPDDLHNPEPDKHTDWVWVDPENLPEPHWPGLDLVLKREKIPIGKIYEY